VSLQCSHSVLTVSLQCSYSVLTVLLQCVLKCPCSVLILFLQCPYIVLMCPYSVLRVLLQCVLKCPCSVLIVFLQCPYIVLTVSLYCPYVSLQCSYSVLVFPAPVPGNRAWVYRRQREFRSLICKIHLRGNLRTTNECMSFARSKPEMFKCNINCESRLLRMSYYPLIFVWRTLSEVTVSAHQHDKPHIFFTIYLLSARA
jgi:hypothetical protein